MTKVRVHQHRKRTELPALPGTKPGADAKTDVAHPAGQPLQTTML